MHKHEKTKNDDDKCILVLHNKLYQLNPNVPLNKDPYNLPSPNKNIVEVGNMGGLGMLYRVKMVCCSQYFFVLHIFFIL